MGLSECGFRLYLFHTGLLTFLGVFALFWVLDVMKPFPATKPTIW
jgi:phosphatidylglycerophosphatase A